MGKLKIANIVIQLEQSEQPGESRIQLLISKLFEGIITCELAQLLGKQKHIQIFASGDCPGLKAGQYFLILRHGIRASFVTTVRWVWKLALPSIPILCEMVDYIADTHLCVKIHADFLSAYESIRRKSFS